MWRQKKKLRRRGLGEYTLQYVYLSYLPLSIVWSLQKLIFIINVIVHQCYCTSHNQPHKIWSSFIISKYDSLARPLALLKPSPGWLLYALYLSCTILTKRMSWAVTITTYCWAKMRVRVRAAAIVWVMAAAVPLGSNEEKRKGNHKKFKRKTSVSFPYLQARNTQLWWPVSKMAKWWYGHHCNSATDRRCRVGGWRRKMELMMKGGRFLLVVLGNFFVRLLQGSVWSLHCTWNKMDLILLDLTTSKRDFLGQGLLNGADNFFLQLDFCRHCHASAFPLLGVYAKWVGSTLRRNYLCTQLLNAESKKNADKARRASRQGWPGRIVKRCIVSSIGLVWKIPDVGWLKVRYRNL